MNTQRNIHFLVLCLSLALRLGTLWKCQIPPVALENLLKAEPWEEDRLDGGLVCGLRRTG